MRFGINNNQIMLSNKMSRETGELEKNKETGN